MAAHATTDFLAGVIEGFYGPPWSPAERRELFDWLAAWGFNTYLYAPKDDLHHRALWRATYPAAEAAALRELIAACGQRGLRFIYALSPGLDIRYGDPAEAGRLHARFDQLQALGCADFALFFDDIPDRPDPARLGGHGSLAEAQCEVANALWQRTRERHPGGRFLFCPTPYCGRMADLQLGGLDYLATLGRTLAPGIDVFWTGPEIISREIPVATIQDLQAVLRRKPVLWDNLHANDYDGRRFFCGPCAGRTPDLRGELRGWFANPNSEFPLNYVPLRTLAQFLHAEGPWDARAAYLAAMREWWPQFATVGQAVSLEDLVLFGDCHYLPHEEGPGAEVLYQGARECLTGQPADRPGAADAFRRNAARLREFCVRMTELRHRPLFHALHRRVWELREELDLIERYLDHRAAGGSPAVSFQSEAHRPGHFRGGLVTRLQRLLVQQADGGFLPARPDEGQPVLAR